MIYHKVESEADEYIWHLICSKEGEVFRTVRGLAFTYRIKRNRAGEQLGEIIIDRRNGKTITRSSLLLAYQRAAELQGTEGCVSGPKKLGVFGASYLYPIFLELGICTKNKSQKGFPGL